MARDGIRLLDALNVDKAHIVGASMGGMISQILCANFPERASSLTAVMTSTNKKGLPTASPKLAHLLLRPGPAPKTTEDIIERSMRMWKAIGTPDSGRSDEELRTRVAAAVDRSYCPKGQRRQLSAIIETGDLRRWTRRIKAPTLVIHGDADPLVNIAGGKDVAANIRGSRMEVISGMAHDLPPRHLQTVTQMIIDHAHAAERSCVESAA